MQSVYSTAPTDLADKNIGDIIIPGYTLLDLDFNKTPREKKPKQSRRELHKDAMCRFEQLLEVPAYKIAIVWPFTWMVCEMGMKTIWIYQC